MWPLECKQIVDADERRRTTHDERRTTDIQVITKAHPELCSGELKRLIHFQTELELSLKVINNPAQIPVTEIRGNKYQVNRTETLGGVVRIDCVVTKASGLQIRYVNSA